PFPHDVCGTVDRLAKVELAHGNEAFYVVADVDNDTLVHQTNHAAVELGADRVGLADLEPRIFLRLLESERDALVVGVDIENHDVNAVALLHDFRRMLNALRPRHVGDVNQAIDAGLDLDERTKAREVPNLAAEPRADRIFLRQN